MRVEQVRRASENSGWFYMDVAEVAAQPVEDYGDRMEFVAADGHRYRVEALVDESTIALRRIA